MAVSLAEAKAQLRVSFDADDAYITSLIEAAEDYVEAVGVAPATPVQPAVRQAVLMLVSHWYSNRDAAGEKPSHAVEFGVDALITPFREVHF